MSHKLVNTDQIMLGWILLPYARHCTALSDRVLLQTGVPRACKVPCPGELP